MNQLSQIEIIGAGPAGLYTAILIRRLLPHVRVRVTEQNPEGATFGFGVVFSNEALTFLKSEDPEIHQMIIPFMEKWENMTLNLPAGQVTLDGVGFTAISRHRLIEVLKEQATDLGIPVRFKTELKSLDALKADIVSINRPKPNICKNNSNLFCVRSNITRLLKPNATPTVITTIGKISFKIQLKWKPGTNRLCTIGVHHKNHTNLKLNHAIPAPSAA